MLLHILLNLLLFALKQSVGNILKERLQFHQHVIFHIRFLLYLHIKLVNLPLQFLNAHLSVIRLLLQDFEFTASLLVCLDDFGIAAYHATTEESNLTLLIIIVLQPLFQIITTVIKGDKLIHSIGTQQILERIKLAFIQESIVVLALQSFLLTLQVSHHIVILHGIRTEAL